MQYPLLEHPHEKVEHNRTRSQLNPRPRKSRRSTRGSNTCCAKREAYSRSQSVLRSFLIDHFLYFFVRSDRDCTCPPPATETRNGWRPSRGLVPIQICISHWTSQRESVTCFESAWSSSRVFHIPVPPPSLVNPWLFSEDFSLRAGTRGQLYCAHNGAIPGAVRYLYGDRSRSFPSFALLTRPFFFLRLSPASTSDRNSLD